MATDEKFSNPDLQLPVADLSFFLEHKGSDEYLAECKKAADSFKQYGVLVIKDPRVREEDNDRFLDVLEKYFDESAKKLYAGQKLEDAKPEIFYQLGVTPELTERPRNHCARVKDFDLPNRPVTECPPELDAKWRFFWRMGERPAESRFPQLNAEPVIPRDFPEWPVVMNSWGSLMLQAVTCVAEMVAEGLDLPANTFTDLMRFGPHLLAPTGSDLDKYGAVGTTLAGYHYDLNFMSIHGRSRFPGLYVWVRDGRKHLVRVPPGCLLLQAGKQFEYLTGGVVLAGFHEVVVCPSTLTAIEKAKQEGRYLWRISSTLFSHVASDNMLQPLPPFKTDETAAMYPPVYAGDQVQNELRAINLAHD